MRFDKILQLNQEQTELYMNDAIFHCVVDKLRSINRKVNENEIISLFADICKINKESTEKLTKYVEKYGSYGI